MTDTTGDIAEQFLQLLGRFIQLRPELIVSEEGAEFKRRMQTLKNGVGDLEDKHQLLRVLIVIAQSPAPPTMGDLSAALGIPLSSATRIIDGLVRAGFAERTNDSRDRRIVRVQMTPTGQEFYAAALRYNKQRVLHILGKFSPQEQAQLLKLMNKLYDSLLAESGPAK